MATSPGNRYRGEPGTTRTKRAHVTLPCGVIISAEVYRSVNVDTDPELGQRLLSDSPERALNVARCPTHGRTVQVHVPVVYHDPGNEIFVLVLHETQRHRELIERAAVMSELAADASVPVPRYVRDVPVVFGREGLNGHIEAQAERVLAEARQSETARELERAREQLETRERDLQAQRSELERMMGEIERRGTAVQERARSLEDRQAALDRRSQELERQSAQLERARRQATPSARGAEPAAAARPAQPSEAATPTRVQAAQPSEAATPTPVRAPASSEHRATRPHARRPESDATPREGAGPHQHTGADATPLPEPIPHHEAAVTHPFELVSTDAAAAEPQPLAAGEVVVADQVISDSGPTVPVSSEGDTRIGANRSDVAIERWIVSRETQLVTVDDSGQVRIAISGEPDEIEPLLGDDVALRLQLHRLPSYPLITLALGPEAAIEGEAGRPYVLQLDLASSSHAAALAALARRFQFTLELFDTEYLPVRKRSIAADLIENVSHILVAAQRHMDAIPARDRSFAKASIAYSNPAYDAFGRAHPERGEFREDKLTRLDTANQVRRALHIARRFSKPEREEYLALTRGYPLRLWRQHRRAVIARAIELGLWIGGPLAQLAVDDGLAPSRKGLVESMQRAFGRLVEGRNPANDLDEDAVADNWAALQREASGLGLDIQGPEPPSPWSDGVDHAPGDQTADLDPGDIEEVPDEPMVSGTIGEGVSTPAGGSGNDEAADRPATELIAMLEDHTRRMPAAVELARRGEQRAIRPVFAALQHMTRSEAVQVLGACPGFGEAATTALLHGLGSRKGFLRQGCALALAILGSEEAIEALADLLLSEPTDIWREVARAIGEVGPAAIMPLLSRLSTQSPDHTPDKAERVAWALAHVSARGGRTRVQTLAEGRDRSAAQVARRGLELEEQARAEDRQVRADTTSKDQTVNRAFTRRFFQSLAVVRPAAALAAVPHEHRGADVSAPAMLLDEADLLEASEMDDEAEQLDENDLIPT